MPEYQNFIAAKILNFILDTRNRAVILYAGGERMKNDIDWEGAMFLFAFIGCPLLAIVSVLASYMAKV